MHSIDAPRRALRLILTLSALSAATIHAQEPAPTLDQRLERLAERLEQERAAQHIPGVAIAIVKDDQVIFARGFGLADIENERPVTEETIFAVGSTTKAFTAALIGTLVEQGRMAWDAPVTDYLPWFTLPIRADDPNASATIRDLLSHRTGFTRMSALWASGRVPREEVLRTAIRAEPWADYREQFLYNNVMYVAAGEAAAAVGGGSWELLMTERLLQPLGMKDATLSVPAAQKDARLSLGYEWDKDGAQFVRKEMRVIDVVGPAGSINAHVLDMARWVRFQLARGEIDGTRLLQADTLESAWDSNIEIAPGASYGMGWMLREWRDRRLVEHGGNIDGFSAQVALLPDDHLGFVLLCNVTASPLQAGAIEIVFDSLLGEWREAGADGATEGDLRPYVGAYHANFGALRDVDLTVAMKDGHLTLDVPGQMVFSLQPPDEHGKWAFAQFPQISASFVRDDADQVIALVIHQNGMNFEAPRVGVEREPELTADDAAPYLGRYHSKQLGRDLEVLIDGGRLAVDVPGQMVFQLHPPDEQGQWVFRAVAQMSVSFERDEAGRVIALSAYRNGELQERCEHLVDEGDQDKLPTAQEIEHLMNARARRERLAALAPWVEEGSVFVAQCGIRGTFSHSVGGETRLRADVDLGQFGGTLIVVRDEQAWSQSEFVPGGPRELRGQERLLAMTANPLFDWEGVYPECAVIRAESQSDRPAWVVRFKGGELPPRTVWVDRETGDVLRVDSTHQLPGAAGAMPVTTLLGDYRDVEGVRLPHRAEVRNEATGRTVLETKSFTFRAVVDDAAFRNPADAK